MADPAWVTLARRAAVVLLGVVAMTAPAAAQPAAAPPVTAPPVAPATAETADAATHDVPNGLVRFRTFGPAEGLHNLVIQSIGQDARGFLWVGSDDGVFQFDGERFTHFGPGDGVAAAAISVLRPGLDGNICAGSRAGLVCWDGTRFSHAGLAGLPAGAVSTIATAQGRMWVGTAAGLYVTRGGELVRAAGWTGTQSIKALWADDRGVIAGDGARVWLSSGDGVWREPPGGLVAASRDGSPHERIEDVLRDRAGAVWIRAANHLWRWSPGAAHVEDLSAGYPAYYNAGPTGTMANGAHGEVWFASDGGIVYRDGDHWRLLGHGEGLPFPGARTLFVDREGSTWVGSIGLFQWRGRGLIERYEPSNGFPGDAAWSFARDRDGALWVGTNRCLAHADHGRWDCLAGTENRTVRGFVFAPHGGVFVGGFPSDLLYLDADGKRVSLGRELDDASDRAILAMTVGPEGDLWIATRGGLFRLPGAVPGRLQRVVIPGVPPDAWYSSLLVEGGRLWAGSSQGVVVREAGGWRVYGAADGFRSSSMRYLIHTASRGYCVSYTEAIGLSCFDRDARGAIIRLAHIGLAEGLGTGAVYYLGEDRWRRLWVGTGDGVDVFTSDRAGVPGGVDHFGQIEGLAGDDAAATAFFEDTDGALWLGSTGGASRFHAERYAGPPPPPRALLRTGQLGNQTIRGDHLARLETPHDLNALKVELGSDHLAATERVEYQVRLTPLEPEWSATLARQARYPALLPGSYQLEVRARIGTGAWGPTTMLAFVVRPAWWQTRWFLACTALVVLIAIGLAFASRQRAELSRRTRQLNAEAAANLRALLELVPDLISVHGDGTVIYGNLAARRMFGLGDGEVTASGLGPRIHPDDRARVAEVLPLPPDAGPSWMSPVIELRVGDDAGGWRTCEVSGVRTELAGATVVVVSGRDVTERHRLRAQLLMSDRMASLGTLAAGIAHEINNPLSYVLGNLQLMKEALPELDNPRAELAIALHDATDGAQRVRKIVQGLRSFSRADEEMRVQLEIADVLRAAIRLTANEVRHRAQLTCELGTTPQVVADDGRLTQVFINLIVNAAHAIPEGSSDQHRITVRTRTDDHGYAVIEIEDTGRGMSPEVLARAFDPFFTTKEVGSGTGLGLSICHGIIGALGGQIEIDSAVGRGTRLRVVLPPAAAPAIAIARTITTPMPLAQRKLRVLVVDDEPLVSDMLARVLRRDHEVVSVSCGRTALDQVTAGAWFDAIVSDVMMPNMTGIELLDALVRIDPGQAKRLIFLSGGVFTPQTRAQLDALGTLQLEKPISPKELRLAVMSVARGEAGEELAQPGSPG